MAIPTGFLWVKRLRDAAGPSNPLDERNKNVIHGVSLNAPRTAEGSAKGGIDLTSRGGMGVTIRRNGEGMAVPVPAASLSIAGDSDIIIPVIEGIAGNVNMPVLLGIN